MHDRDEKYTQIVSGKSEGLAILRGRWEDNIKMDLK